MFISLDAVELAPAIELTPGTFATRERPLPAGTGPDAPEEWAAYWRDSLADAGVIGLTPLRAAPWLVAVRFLTDAGILGQILAALVRGWGGPEALPDPDGKAVLSGGFALCARGEVLVEPGCCGDLDNLSERKRAAAYRGPAWRMVWVGHPWVSVRFDEGRLVVSDPHESDAPTGRWVVRPDALDRAVAAAEAELAGFVRRLVPVLGAVSVPDARPVARRSAGFDN